MNHSWRLQGIGFTAKLVCSKCGKTHTKECASEPCTFVPKLTGLASKPSKSKLDWVDVSLRVLLVASIIHLVYLFFK